MRFTTWMSRYQKFFKEHAGYPKFKSKHDNHKSYTTNFTNGNITVDFGCNRVKLPKLKGIKAKLHRNFIGQIKSATISQVPSGKYYVSILVETEHVELPHINQNTGIDLGIKPNEYNVFHEMYSEFGGAYAIQNAFRKKTRYIRVRRWLVKHKALSLVAMKIPKISNKLKDYPS